VEQRHFVPLSALSDQQSASLVL